MESQIEYRILGFIGCDDPGSAGAFCAMKIITSLFLRFFGGDFNSVILHSNSVTDIFNIPN